jgi:hypothetical protein
VTNRDGTVKSRPLLSRLSVIISGRARLTRFGMLIPIVLSSAEVDLNSLPRGVRTARCVRAILDTAARSPILPCFYAAVVELLAARAAPSLRRCRVSPGWRLGSRSGTYGSVVRIPEQASSAGPNLQFRGGRQGVSVFMRIHGEVLWKTSASFSQFPWHC